jgi:hypothetical protein
MGGWMDGSKLIIITPSTFPRSMRGSWYFVNFGVLEIIETKTYVAVTRGLALFEALSSITSFLSH